MRSFDRMDQARPRVKADEPARPPKQASADGRFVGDVVRMLGAYLSVAFINLVVCSLITHKLRFWFPAWLDAHWDSNPDSWVTYSQSYVAGIVFLPVLVTAVVREFVPTGARVARMTILAGTMALLAFIAWWKGGLMIQYHKGQEALAWIVLTAVTWGLIRLGEELPALAARVSPRRLAIRLAQVCGHFLSRNGRS